MRNIAKKIMIYSMVGMMQIGLGATVIEASPLFNDNEGSQRIVQLDEGYYHDGDRQREHGDYTSRHPAMEPLHRYRSNSTGDHFYTTIFMNLVVAITVMYLRVLKAIYTSLIIRVQFLCIDT